MRLIPVVVIDDVSKAAALGQALKRGGLGGVEVTFRTRSAEEALRILAADGDMLVGAGTIVRTEQAEAALRAGARYIVTPGFSLAVVQYCQERGVPVFSGVMTPTEIQMALDAGLDTMKFFPAEIAGGTTALTALSQVYPSVRFIPTGGITPDNLARYLTLRSVLAVGGSWMATPDLIRSGSFAEIYHLAAAAVAVARQTPPRHAD